MMIINYLIIGLAVAILLTVDMYNKPNKKEKAMRSLGMVPEGLQWFVLAISFAVVIVMWPYMIYSWVTEK